MAGSDSDLAAARADSFHRLIDQLKATAGSLSLSYPEARRLVLQRERLDTLQQVYSRVRTQILPADQQPLDVTISRTPGN